MKLTVLARGDRWPPGVSDGLVLPCKCCGRVSHFDYTVDDFTWQRVVPPEWRRYVVCLPCFDALQNAAGYWPEGYLERVQFTGVGHTIILVPQQRIVYTQRGRRKDEAT
jgi:hypothetical protein